MIRNITRRQWLSSLVTAVLVFTPLVSFANAPAPTKKQARYEIDFMTDMIDHHAMAVAMASVCTNKAIHPELHQLCENIIASQSAEIQEMQTWLQDWYGITYEPQMKPGDEKKIHRLAQLSGAEFEIQFMEMMIKHHTVAVRKGMDCMDRAYHAELIQLCENIVQTQSQEIEMMQTWLCQWYQICELDPNDKNRCTSEAGLAVARFQALKNTSPRIFHAPAVNDNLCFK